MAKKASLKKVTGMMKDLEKLSTLGLGNDGRVRLVSKRSAKSPEIQKFSGL